MGASNNPRIKEITIGTHELRSVTVYPISYGQKIKSKAFTAFAEMLDGLTVGDVDVEKLSLSKTMISVVKDHVSELVFLATGKENLVDEIDGYQMVELCEILYDQNFKPYEKKITEILRYLREKGSESNTQSATSSSDTRDTTSVTSISDQSATGG